VLTIFSNQNEVSKYHKQLSTFQITMMFTLLGGKSHWSFSRKKQNPLWAPSVSSKIAAEVNMNSSSMSELDHSRGKTKSPIQLIEYADFENPYCGMAFYEIEKLLSTDGDNICFTYRHFPDSDKHRHALLAAIASEAAGDQGKFWQMHDLLFENQENLSVDTIEYFAEVLGLDMEPFRAALQSKTLKEKVASDRQSGIDLGVSIAPTLFLNGRKLDRLVTAEELKIAVEEELFGRREPVVNS
jgi:protein-disulfide isomerase